MGRDWTDLSVSWQGESTFIAKNKDGGLVQMGPVGDRPGVGPMQLLLAGLAGCTGMDIISILSKKRLKPTQMQIQVSGKRADDYPMVWTDIKLQYLIWGEGIPPKDVEQAIKLSEEKYCSVGIMLGKTARITSEYRILTPGTSIEMENL